MNIANVTELGEQLESLGFKGLQYTLLKKICLLPLNFTLTYEDVNGEDSVGFEIYFERQQNTIDFIIKFYDAYYDEQTNPASKEINGIDLTSLEQSFNEIDWINFFDPSIKKMWKAEDKDSWEQENKVQLIIEKLTALEKSADGKLFANNLKYKYWSKTPFHNNFITLALSKPRRNICQRFYFSPAIPGISMQDCKRFLQNMRLEKTEHLRQKSHQPSTTQNLKKKENSLKKNYTKKNL